MLELPENALLQALRNGDHRAFTLLYNHYAPYLHKEAFYLTHDHQHAEDITHSILSDLWERREKIDITISLKAYLIRAVHFQHCWYLRKVSYQKRYLEAIQTGIEDKILQALEKKELLGRLQRAISKIPSLGIRNITALYYLEQMNHREIGQALDITPEASRTQSSRGIKALRQLLKQNKILSYL